MTDWTIDYVAKKVTVDCANGGTFEFIAECDVYDDYALATEIREKIFGQ